MAVDRQAPLTPHAIFGVVIALMGVIFTLDNLGLIGAGVLLQYWPLAPVLVGIMMLMKADEPREWVFGTAWMAGGGLLLARNLGYISFSVRDLLPLLLVALGVQLVWRSRRPVEPPPAPSPAPGPEWDDDAPLGPAPLSTGPFTAEPSFTPPPIPPIPPPAEGTRAWDDAGDRNREESRRGGCGPFRPRARFREHSRRAHREWERWTGAGPRTGRTRRGIVRMMALMSGVERRVRGEAFHGAEMTAIMGACEIDLRHAQMAGTEAHISAFAIWGGIEIRVPPDWVVVNQAMALMGGVEDSTRHVDAPGRPRLYVNGFALMAGIDIRN